MAIASFRSTSISSRIACCCERVTADVSSSLWRRVPSPTAEMTQRLRALGVEVHIWTMPSEIEDAVPFERDREHAAYDADAAQRFWRQLVQADRVMNIFRGRFQGKCSPVHF